MVAAVLTAAFNGGTPAPSAPAAGGGKDFGDLINEGAQIVPRIAEAAAVLLVSILVVIAVVMLIATMWKRVRRASLVVRPFLDGAVGIKVGPGVASLVEERLVGALRRKDALGDGYDLDRVATDIELLAEDNDLAKAMERLADVPQFKLVVAVMELIERLLPTRGLSAAGELLPAGRDGAGVSLALYKGNRLTARSSLWETQVNMWFPGEHGSAPPESFTPPSDGNAPDPSPHYGLAAPAAWWVQYEAARVLDKNVSLVTNSAPSFSLVGIALGRERQGRVRVAEDAYAGALTHDPNNVAALFNLAQLLAREHSLYAPAALLLVRASESLVDRHLQGTNVVSRWEKSEALSDPTWYRVRYALAVRRLHVADAQGDDKADEDGRLGAITSVLPEGGWSQEFGPETEALLDRLFEDQKSVRSTLERPAAAALDEAGRLFTTTSMFLDSAGWHWVGRKPPRYLSWAKRLSPRWWRERPVAGDAKLAGFLSDVVEPAAAILYCSAWLAQGEDAYDQLRDAVLARVRANPRPLDRRDLLRQGEENWAIEYLGSFLADQQIDTSRSARLEAVLGRTQYRAPREPAPRVRYSLSCLLSRLATEAGRKKDEMAREAFVLSSAAQLEGALSNAPSGWRDRLAKWAGSDPDLSGLREQSPEAFATIVAMWGPSERRRVERKKLKSSAVSSAAYVPDGEILELELADGSRYQYFEVPRGIYEELIEDPSPGGVFSKKIASKYAFIRL